MTVNYVMAVDPGKATGVAIGRYSVSMPVEIIYTAIIPEGVRGFCEWLHLMQDGKKIVENDCSKSFPENWAELDWHLDYVCENFSLRGGGFAPDLEPVRIEGVMIDHFGHKVNWQKPADKALVGDDFLKEHELWVTGKDVGHADGRDANDATIHLFVYMMRQRHIPTLEAYWR